MVLEQILPEMRGGRLASRSDWPWSLYLLPPVDARPRGHSERARKRASPAFLGLPNLSAKHARGTNDFDLLRERRFDRSPVPSATCHYETNLHPKVMAEIVDILGGYSDQAEHRACPDEAENAL